MRDRINDTLDTVFDTLRLGAGGMVDNYTFKVTVPGQFQVKANACTENAKSAAYQKR